MKKISFTESLSYKRPDIAKEWDYSKNGKFTPEQVKPGSGERVNWICPKCGLGYPARINDRCNPKKNSKCPACFGTHAVKGYSDLATTRPDLAKEWDYSKNPEDKNPTTVKANSHFPAYWLCPNGHPSYRKKIEERNNGRGCPECEKEKNTYLVSFPELIKEWDYDKNGSYEGITIGSSKSYSWICQKCGNRWDAPVYSRSSGHGCESCRKKEGAKKRREAIAKKTHNTIAERRPDLLAWWDYEKNEGVDPARVLCTSTLEYHWKCPVCGYPWSTAANIKVRSKRCPACSSHVVWKGHNDFKTLYPELALEWSDDNSVNPDDILPNSHYYANWKCRICGHPWPARVAERTKINGTGCPKCKTRYQSSFPEQAVFYYIKNNYPDTVRRFRPKWIGKSEIDIYIPSISTGIEYDGYTWHRNKKDSDEKKGTMAKLHSIRLIRIREKGCPSIDDESICFSTTKFEGQRSYDSLGSTIKEVISFLKQNDSEAEDININIAEDYQKIYASFLSDVGKKSVASLFPEIAAEWDPALNNGLKPEFFLPGSSVEITWRCSVCGETWPVSISERCGRDKSGCPVCSNRVIASGINDFASKHPNLFKLWDYEKNNKLGIDPKAICPSHRDEVNWICEKGHPFTATTVSMVRGKKCPYCSNRLVWEGFNDLASTFPDVALDWDYSKNGDKTPNSVVYTSSEKVWWICHVCGHPWERVVGDRTVRHHGCKKCADERRRKKK